MNKKNKSGNGCQNRSDQWGWDLLTGVGHKGDIWDDKIFHIDEGSGGCGCI
jgi:hypothetical protein